MSISSIRALTFDTGGTILDWHSGFRDSLARIGRRHGLERDWAEIANELRRRALGKMLNLGKDAPPAYNFDDAHRMAVDELCSEYGLDAIGEADRHAVAWDTPHAFRAWQDFPSVLPELRSRFICASFTILSFRIIIDTARRNGLAWDSVFSCEAIGKYKVLPEAYRTVADWLVMDPGEICMVACHNFDLDAARAVGFRTAFVRRPHEWGPAGPPDPDANPACDIIVDTFPELARQLGL